MKRIRTVSICVGFIIAGLYIWGNYTFEAFLKKETEKRLDELIDETRKIEKDKG